MSLTRGRPVVSRLLAAVPPRLTGTLAGALVTVALLGLVLWGAIAAWSSLSAAGSAATMALWTLPIILALHLVQLQLAGAAWRALFVPTPLGLLTFLRLRLVREAVNTMLPVAHVGGEVVAVRMLARRGVAVSRGTASIVVDISSEVVAQLGFLLLGLALLASLSGTGSAWLWAGTVAAGVLACAGLLAAQRFGGLRLLERLVERAAASWPGLPAGRLVGLDAAAVGFYRRRRALAASFALHLAAWALGAGEVWIVMSALDTPVGPRQALVIEALGMAARSAGFAVPGALGIQEGGFVLAAAALGLPPVPALSLSLIKRLREVLAGLAGVLIWRLAERPAKPMVDQPAQN